MGNDIPTILVVRDNRAVATLTATPGAPSFTVLAGGEIPASLRTMVPVDQ